MALPSEVTNGARATGSISTSDKYFVTGPRGIEFTEEGYIKPDTVEEMTLVVELSDPRDITAAVNATSTTEVVDAGILYDDESYTRTFPIADAIIEHRPKMCVSSVRKTTDGSSQFTTGYGVSYVSLGIPKVTMDVLLGALEDEFKECPWAADTTYTVSKLQENDGYSWLPVKIPETLAGSAMEGARGIPVHSVPELIKSAGKSIVCDAFVSMRLKRVLRTKIRNASPWELAMTVTYVQVSSFTTKSSPPIYNTPSIQGRDKRATDDVIQAIRSMSITGGNSRAARGRDVDLTSLQAPVAAASSGVIPPGVN